jgi:microcystin-dependent protein
VGVRAGVETVTLTTDQIPRHTHSIQASTNAATQQPAGGAVLGGVNIYTDDTSQELQPLYSVSIGSNDGGQSHNNMMPYCAIHFIIALQGVYPSRN